MLSVKEFPYAKDALGAIANWGFGTNWPVVYVVYNDRLAYVGETLDAARRTEQHLAEPEFDCFETLCLISDMTFNKSVILNLESFLIKYMAGDGSKRLTNGNAGVYNHNYFYKEAYEDEFKAVWRRLIKLGIVRRSIIDIENSELFKYSPYKTLNAEQQGAVYQILEHLHTLNDASMKSLVTVTGGAGTGKTILAVYLVKLLHDISRNKEIWRAIDDTADALVVRKASEGLEGMKTVALVVPMRELRNTMRSIFRSVEGLDESQVLAPEDVVKGYYDVLVVDEAHRLYRRKHLPGTHLYVKFDRINEKLMGDAFHGDENDLTELDWIFRSSRMQVLFFDDYQFIRVPDIGRERFQAICAPHQAHSIELTSQMRCRGGNAYLKYVRTVLTTCNLDKKSYLSFSGYELRLFDDVEDLFLAIRTHDAEDGLCKVVTGPGWALGQDIEISGHTYHWYTDNDPDPDNAVYSVHKTQGFDLNYTGVIFGKEVYYDRATRRIEIRKAELKDNHTKSDGAKAMRTFVLNIYTVLMTRGIKGTYLYAMDQALSEYLGSFFVV